jgi:hypothetical protein
MIRMLRKILKPFIPQSLLNKRYLEKWEKNGRPVPPPDIVKQKIIQEYQKKYGHSILLETGTYIGTMVQAQKKIFKKIISIELGLELFKKAKKRFAKDKNIEIVHGNSAEVLSEILKQINKPAIFWLDGHYSAGITAMGDKVSPVLEELEAIANSGNLNHIILIDDARCFTGNGGYPTIDQLTDLMQKKNDKYRFSIENDIIRFVA